MQCNPRPLCAHTPFGVCSEVVRIRPSNRNGVIAVVRDWLVKAEHDLLNATHTLKLSADCPTDTVSPRALRACNLNLPALP